MPGFRRQLLGHRQSMPGRLDLMLFQPLKHIAPNRGGVDAAVQQGRFEAAAKVVRDGTGPLHYENKLRIACKGRTISLFWFFASPGASLNPSLA